VIPLRSSGSANPAGREISSLTRLEANSRCWHPNLLQIHHVGKTATHLFYVMDPADDVSGRPASIMPNYRPATLQSILQEGPLAPELCLDYARQLLAGLAMLHSAGMVHRDVKPANCLFVGGQLKLADFGLLTEAHPLASRVGTRSYMPPDGRMDTRADVYAAGLVIYEMLSGLPVDEFPRLGGRSKEVGSSPILTTLLQLVLKACEPESEKRPPDAGAMLAELDVPIGSGFRPSRRRLLVVIGAAAIVAIVGVGVWMSQEDAGTGYEAAAEKFVAAESNSAAVPATTQLTEVSFVTTPFEAKICIDDQLQRDADREPYRTPCTIRVPARTCRVAFQCDSEPPWGAQSYDLSRTQQIVSQRP
jgi:serine/threonine protein kinase